MLTNDNDTIESGVRGCENCKHFREDEETCRLKNCHRAYSRLELENKDIVTDAWESAE